MYRFYFFIIRKMKEYKENSIDNKKTGKRFNVSKKTNNELSDNLTKQERLKTTDLLKQLVKSKTFGWEIHVSENTKITDFQAKILWASSGAVSDIRLDTPDLTDEQVKRISKFTWSLILWLKELSDKKAESLWNSKALGLYLRDLESITDEQAEALSKFKWDTLLLWTGLNGDGNWNLKITDKQKAILEKWNAMKLYINDEKLK